MTFVRTLTPAAELLGKASEFVSDVTPTDDLPRLRAMTAADMVRAYADMILEDWDQLDRREQVKQLVEGGRQIETRLGADQFLGVDEYGDEAELYD